MTNSGMGGDAGTDKGAGAPLWSPSGEDVRRSRMTHFMRWAGERHERSFEDYWQLWDWSVGELEEFWAAIWEFCGVRASAPYERVLRSREMPGARWFEGARLNYAENMLMRPRAAAAGEGGDGAGAGDRSGQLAVLAASELRPLTQLTWGQLSGQVAAVAQGLRELGVGPGDRVAAYMPNIPETLVAFLACASIGAIWSSAAPEFGPRTVLDRFAQIEPKVLLAVDGYRHGGRDFDRREQLGEILRGLPSVRHTVVLPYLAGATDASAAGKGDAPSSNAGDATDRSTTRARAIGLRSPPDAMAWEQLVALGAGAQLRFEQLPFDHPLWVLYSSGTTGLPKAIAHGHGGILVEQLKKSLLHLDLRAGDRMFWFTTTGWMMWNFLIGCLFSDAAIVLYDGSPAHPDLGALWDLAQRTGMTCMGTSAGLLTGCAKAGIEPARSYDLTALRAIGSTGSPLPPEGFRWVYEHVGENVWLFSTSGGTDVCTAFVGGCPLLPVYEGELQCRVLGCAVEAWDEQGRPLIDEVGELVLTKPLPSMPLYLWGDRPGGSAEPAHSGERGGTDDQIGSEGRAGTDRRAGTHGLVGERYRESYFSMYPGVWRHGDWVRITPRGGAVIYGRSDSTINRRGVRMGTSEIYRATAAMDEVLDALVVDVPRAGGDGGELSMMLFVVLRPGLSIDEQLRERIRRRIREECSPRHVPDEISQIEEVPRTLSGKTLEVPVKRILMGAEPAQVASRESLANPDALEYFVQLAARLGGAPTEPS